MTRKMSEREYLTVINSYEVEARLQNRQSGIITDSEELTRRYNGELYGDEVPEKSSVVSNDVQDVVESDMPSLARNFLSAKKICVFQPTSESEEDVKEARQKTEYIDWIVRGQPDSFRIQHGFLKDIDTIKAGALKWIIEDLEEKRTVTHENISALEVDALMESLKGKDVKKVEMIGRASVESDNIELPGDDVDESFDIEFEVTTEVRRARVIGIPLESLLISPGASSEEDATLVGDTVSKTRGELLAEGFKMKVVDTLQLSSQGSNSTLSQIRLDDSGNMSEADFGVWSNEVVEISDLYVMVDKNGDGRAQRRHIVKSGDTILSDEPFEKVPYAITSAILIPHSVFGKSRAEIAAPFARVNTALVRGMLDNTYAHNAPQIAINDNVNRDDLTVRRNGGLVRVKGKDNPGQSMFPVNIAYVGDKALQVIQYMQGARASSLGTLLSSQGLQSDTFEKETASRFNGTRDEGAAKIELVARVIAETAYRRVYEGLAWLIGQYQTTKEEIMVLGEPLIVDPASWEFEQTTKSKIGLGAGDGEGSTETFSSIINLQTQLKASGSSLVDDVKSYNAINSLLESLDIHDTSSYFNNPEREDQLVVRENEVLRGSVEQLQKMVQEMQEQIKNPLAEAETIRAQAKLETATGEIKLDIIKEAERARQFDVEQAEKVRQFNISTGKKQEMHDDKVAVEITKLETDSGKDLAGGIDEQS